MCRSERWSSQLEDTVPRWSLNVPNPFVCATPADNDAAIGQRSVYPQVLNVWAAGTKKKSLEDKNGGPFEMGRSRCTNTSADAPRPANRVCSATNQLNYVCVLQLVADVPNQEPRNGSVGKANDDYFRRGASQNDAAPNERKSINEFDRTKQPKRSREGMQWGVLGESVLLERQCNAMDTQQPTAAVQNDGPMCTKNDGFLTVGPKWSIGAIARNQNMG